MVALSLPAVFAVAFLGFTPAGVAVVTETISLLGSI